MNASDQAATERIIGGLVVVGVASLLNWSASQGGDPGLAGIALVAVMVGGVVWTVRGLFEILTVRATTPQDPLGLTDRETPRS